MLYNKSTWKSWAGFSFLLVLGVCVLGLYVFSVFFGITPEANLLNIEGIPQEVKLTNNPTYKTQCLTFRIGEYHSQYCSDQPQFERVLSAVTSRTDVSIWISLHQETIFPNQDPKRLYNLYKLSLKGSSVLNYEETVQHVSKLYLSLLFVGGLIFVVAVLGLVLCYKRANQFGTEPKPTGTDSHPTSQRRLLWSTALLTILVYATVVLPIFSPEGHDRLVVRHGDKLMGIPILFSILLIKTLLFLPMPYVFWHIMKLYLPRQKYKYTTSVNSDPFSENTISDIRRSQVISAIGFIYLLITVLSF